MFAIFSKIFTILVCLSLLTLTYGQSTLGEGRILVQTPSAVVTCGVSTIQWIWTGSSSDATSHTLSIAVIQSDGEDQSSSFRKRRIEPEQITHHGRSIKRSTTKKMIRLQPRTLAVELSAGQNVPMNSGSWVWDPVAIPPGTYQMALTVNSGSYTALSASFSIGMGSSTTCLGNTVDSTFTLPSQSSTTSASASSSTSSTSTTASNSSENSNGGLASTSTSQTPVATSSAPVANQSQSQQNTNSSGSGNSSNDGGKIAAGVLVPLLAIGGAIAFFYCCRKRKMDEASERRQGWSEKAITLLNRGKSTNEGATHNRTISRPTNPIHSAGLTHHDRNIRNEMIEAREGCTPVQSVHVKSQAGTVNNEHWVDFAGETDACPITSNHFSEIVRVSMEQSQDDRTQETMIDSGRVKSDSSSQSSLPAYLRDVRSPAPSFGQEADGQPIVSQLDDKRSSQSSTQTHELSGSSSITSNATFTVERKKSVRDLTRNDSKSSVRRKPVPRISISSAPIESNEHGPFADDKEEISSPKEVHAVEEPTHLQPLTLDSAPPIQSRLSAVSGRTIGEEQLHTMLDGETEILQTPRHSSSADVPESVHASPMSILKFSPRIGEENERISKFSSSPLRFEGSDRQSLSPEEAEIPSDNAQMKAWKLSIRLEDQDRGFRVSFPSAMDNS